MSAAGAIVKIDRMTDADLLDVARIAQLVFPSDGDPSRRIQDELARPWTHLWVARMPTPDARVVGYLITWLVVDEVHVLNVAVDPFYQRRGIGRALVERARDLATEHGATSIVLEVRVSNTEAIRLYEGANFGIVRTRKRYYDDGEDAFEMLSLRDPATGVFSPGSA